MIRWMFLFRYPDGVPQEEGERWYLGTHVPEARQMREHGLIGYRTWKGLKTPYESPYQTVESHNQWDRVTELWFEDFEAFRRCTTDHGVNYTPAPYNNGVGFDYHTIFLGKDPEYDFLAEDPVVP
jgi:hypothetical protein